MFFSHPQKLNLSYYDYNNVLKVDEASNTELTKITVIDDQKPAISR